MKKVELIATDDDVGIRLDTFLTSNLKNHSRTRIQHLINQGNASVSGQITKPNYKIKAGEKITLQLPEEDKIIIEPEKIKLDIIHEDKDIIVINKPQGMLVHPHTGEFTGTLVNALLYYSRELSTIGGELRPGIVHRIDRNTSGLLVAAKNDIAHLKLAKQLKSKTMSRIYLSIVENNIKQDKGTIDAPIGRHPNNRRIMTVIESGRNAVTHFEVIERYKEHVLIQLSLTTGRTHQIRVHMKHLGNPVLGDPVYGSRKKTFSSLKGQALHAYKLELVHPRTSEHMEFTTPLPVYFDHIIKVLKKYR